MDGNAALPKTGLGATKIMFFVIAAAAPLTGTLGAIPIVIGLGNGAGAAGAFVSVGLLLLLFSVGFTRLSRHIEGQGAFYAYIAKGLGGPLGSGAALVAVASYTAIQLALYGLFGFFCNAALPVGPFGVMLPWWVFAVAALLATHWMGQRQLDVNAGVLGTLMCLEMAIVLLVVIAIVWMAPLETLTLAPFDPAKVFTGGYGIATMFALACFMGFEATAIYAAEARDPRRTIPFATYLSVIVITLFFGIACWAITCAYGTDAIRRKAVADPGGLWFVVTAQLLGSTVASIMNMLLLSSIFASILAFHNAIARYFLAMAKDGYVPVKILNSSTDNLLRRAYETQSLSMVVGIGVCIAVHADPYVGVFGWMSSFATIGILLLQILVCLSVVAHFRRHPGTESTWAVAVAPVLSFVGLGALMVVIIRNIPLLAGVPDQRLYWLPVMQLALMIAGITLFGRNSRRPPARPVGSAVPESGLDYP